MRKIYDVQTIFNEMDLCYLRFSILDPYVDYFVVNEANTTFSGKPKKLYFQENIDRFKKFEHKIIYNMFDENKPEWTQWDRDCIHKNAAMKALEKSNLDDGDIVFYSDADEIWNPKAVDFSNFKEDILYILYQKTFYYYINTEWYDINNPYKDIWRGSKYSSYGLLKQHSFDTFRDWGSYFHRDNQYKKEYINNGGWHFSFLGGANNIKLKIDSYGHQEFNCPPFLDNIQNNIDNLKDPFFRPYYKIRVIDLDPNIYPAYLMDHLDEYDKYIYRENRNE